MIFHMMILGQTGVLCLCLRGRGTITRTLRYLWTGMMSIEPPVPPTTLRSKTFGLRITTHNDGSVDSSTRRLGRLHDLHRGRPRRGVSV